MAASKISVIIPTLNESGQIGVLTDFLLRHGAGEVIVVDGGSTDATAEAAAAAGARVLPSPSAGRAVQMNFGARHALFPVLYFVHADTLPPDTFVSDIDRAFREGYSMGCYRYRFNSDRLILKMTCWFTRFQFLWCQGGDKTFFIRREVFDAFKGYDEYYSIMEEYDFLRRAMKIHRLKIIPKYALVSARKYEQNSWLRVQIANFAVFNLFRLGMAPQKLKRIYKTLLRPYA